MDWGCVVKFSRFIMLLQKALPVWLLLQTVQFLTRASATFQCRPACSAVSGANMPTREIIMNDELGERTYVRSDTLLGAGTFCRVYMGELHRRMGESEDAVIPVAIRVIEKEKDLKEQLLQDVDVRAELTIHKLVSDGEFILKLLDFFEDEHFYYFMLEYVDGGNLYTRAYRKARKYEALAPSQIEDIFDQIVKGVGYLHKKGVLHRDLKLDNIMLMDDINGLIKIKIIDFGFAIMMHEKEDYSFQAGRCGTLIYKAPETSKHLYSTKSDIFALGVILYEMYMRKPPARSGQYIPGQLILQSELRQKGVSEKSVNRILGMLDRDPRTRFSVDDVLSDAAAIIRFTTGNHEYRLTGASLGHGIHQVVLYDGSAGPPFLAMTLTSVIGLPVGEISKLKNQLVLYSDLGHANILKQTDAFVDNYFAYSITEWIEGGMLLVDKASSLASLNTRIFSEDQARFTAQQIINGLAYLHEEKHISHGNLSIKSVFVASEALDGVSRMVVKLTSFKSVDLAGSAGGEAVHKDIYELGKIMLVLICKWSPELNVLATPIPRVQFQKLLINASPSTGVRDLITRILINEDLDSPITLLQIKNHPWITAASGTGRAGISRSQRGSRDSLKP